MAEGDIAIVGIGVRFPDAPTAGDYWANLRTGRESVRDRTADELVAAGESREKLLRPNYVPSAVVLDGAFDFDAEFFGFSPKEAAIMDPQHRQFLQAAWEALEDSGHVPERFDGPIGVFAGSGMNGYFALNLLTNPALVEDVGMFLLRHTGNDKDFLTTRASYLLDLRGPSLNVQTACSTSLVAAHLAAAHLLSGECDLALAGGVTVEVPHGRGYLFEEGEILSPDGHCRAFDHRAQGTIFGSGAGVVVLRRLDDALDDGDHVYAVIRGTAVNNDGSQKVGYLAPSVDGQASCIAEALAVADVEPRSIGYVECHGTGTAMGDPIEVAALTQAFRAGTDERGFCRIGSVKTNIGHLDTAAGVASLVKVALALHHGELPPSLNYEAPNPQLDLDATPFVVNDELRPWPAGAEPRRAAVNSLGVGGTNAFAVLEEAPPRPARTDADEDGPRLLVVSGRTAAALADNAARLADHLDADPSLDLADVAWTLRDGRRHFAERRVLAARTVPEAVALLRSGDRRRVHDHSVTSGPRSVAFLLPGGGAQYPRMARGLYDAHPTFAEHVDAGLRLLDADGIDLRGPLLAGDGDLDRMSLQLPAIFLVEHALARLLQSWGVEPTALAGHSLGENTAACLAGTMTFEGCLRLVALRGRLMDRVPGGAVSVPMAPEQLAPLLAEHDVDLAIVNLPDLCVVSGTVEAVERFEAAVAALGVEPQRVKVATPVHGRLLEPILAEFRAHLAGMDLRPPTVPWVSNTTGTWITDEQATDPDYWAGHLRSTVRFDECLATLTADPGWVLVEVGPGRMLSSLARMSPGFSVGHAALPTLRHPDEDVEDDTFLLATLGRLWAVGVDVDLESLPGGGPRRRVPLPTYAFQTSTYFIEPGAGAAAAADDRLLLDREDDEDRWYWRPTWSSRDRDEETEPEPLDWLVLYDEPAIGEPVVAELRRRGDRVVVARTGDAYRAVAEDEYVFVPELGREGYDELVRDLVRSGRVPDRIAHLGLLATSARRFRLESNFFHRNHELGFLGLVFLAQAWAEEGAGRPVHVTVGTTGAHRVLATDTVPWPEQATVLGPALVLPRELPELTIGTVDLDPAALAALAGANGRGGRGRKAEATPADTSVVGHLVDELRGPPGDDLVALRGERRFVRTVTRTAVPEPAAGGLPLRRGGVVLVTGGLGGIGAAVAEELAATSGARLALLTRTPVAEGDERRQRVAALEAAGAEVLLVHGDVADIGRMREVLAEVHGRFGALHGIVHAAGVVDDGPILARTQAELDHVLSPKVYGTLVLAELIDLDELDLFVAFSSTSTVSAPAGQTDYVAANAFLNAFVESRHAAGARNVQAIDWGVWADVGMAARAVEDEPRPVPSAHPMLDERRVDRRGTATFSSRWDPAAAWFLDEHRTAAGDALLPGSAYPELARAALAELGVRGPFELRDLTFLQPLAAPDGATTEVRTTLTPTAEGYRFEVRRRVEVDGASPEAGAGGARAGWRATAEATLALSEQPAPAPVDLDAAVARCTRPLPRRTRQQDHLRFGPRWDVVTKAASGDGEAVAWLHLADGFHGDLDAVGLHPALVDLGTGFAMDLIEGYTGDTLWVPIGHRSIRVHGDLPADVVAVARLDPASGESTGFATFDVELCRPDGTVAVAVEGFTVKRLDEVLDLSVDSGALAERVELDAEPGGRQQPTRSETALRHNLANGIRAEEGRRAFTRATATAATRPVLYVSSLDLVGLRDQADEAAAAQQAAPGAGSGVVFARPQLDTDYLAPRDDIEETLVGIWQELLGVGQVGVRDDFFELGGHSLVAVRLFARVKRVFAVEFPISILFEAPTVEAVAALIAAAVPGRAADDAATTAAAPRPRYKHLVAMHAGETGGTRPLFLVAGMGGNVLNLRHLANQIGTDRPFFGIQARGVVGGEAPHEDFVEMAAAYLEEVRAVQPHGPYLLGGYSGGGIAAFEMARQLRAAGEEVALLAMLDTPTAHPVHLDAGDRVRLQLAKLRSRGLRHLVLGPLNRLRWAWTERKGVPTDEIVRPDQTPTPELEAVEAAFYRALERYETKPYDGVVTLYRPAFRLRYELPGWLVDEENRIVFPDNGWGAHARRVDVTEVPGHHHSMVLEPHVRVLAGHLRAAVLAADAAG